MSTQQRARSEQDTGQQISKRSKAQPAARQEDRELAQRRNEQQREALRPPVDVFEDDQNIVLTADLPGVSNEGLNIEVDGDSLLIEGDANLAMPDKTRPLYAEVRNVYYRRSFALSSELDTAAVEANLKEGVLTLRLPKRAEARSRKIKVKA